MTARTAPDEQTHPHRHCRPAQYRQIDADQPPARRGAAVDRAGSRHHARCHRGRSDVARPALSHPRHCRSAPPLADRGETRKAFGRRHAQCHPFRRSRDRARSMRRRRSKNRTPALPIWSSRKGAPSSSRINKWDLVEAEPGAQSRLREHGRSAVAADQGRAGRRAVGAHRAGLDRLMEAVMKAMRCGTAVCRRRRSTVFWRRRSRKIRRPRSRPPLPARLHHAAESAAADFRPVFVARRSAARDLSALSDQRLAREIRAARHADPADAAGEGQSVCGQEAPPR